MTQIGTYDNGQSSRMVRIDPAFPVTTGSNANVFSFEQLQTRAENGLQYGVLGFVMVLPTLSFAQVADKFVDGVSLWQLISSIQLKLADNTPPSKFDGGDFLITGVDGPRAANAMQFMSGVPTILNPGKDVYDFFAAPAGVDTTPADVRASYGAVKRNGWLPTCGPFAGAVGAATFASQVYLFLPVGVAYGEPSESSAIPASWFAGQYDGCSKKQAAGYLRWTFGQTVDNAAVTYTGTTIGLYALMTTYPKNKQPYPCTPYITQQISTGSSYRARRGIRSMLMLQKPLTAAGAQQTHNYTTVRVLSNGVEIIESDVITNITGMAAARTVRWRGESERALFGINLAEQALSFRQAARYDRWGVPLLLHDGKNTKAPGVVNGETLVDIVSTGESTHYYIDATWTPRTPEGEKSAVEWSGSADARVGSDTTNGNTPNPLTGTAFVTPGVVSSPLTHVRK